MNNNNIDEIKEKNTNINDDDSFFEELHENDTSKPQQIINIDSTRNTLGTTIKVLCWIILIADIIFGIYLISEEYDETIIINLCVPILIYDIIGFAIAEIIQILHDIRNKLYSK